MSLWLQVRSEVDRPATGRWTVGDRLLSSIYSLAALLAYIGLERDMWNVPSGQRIGEQSVVRTADGGRRWRAMTAQAARGWTYRHVHTYIVLYSAFPSTLAYGSTTTDIEWTVRHRERCARHRL